MKTSSIRILALLFAAWAADSRRLPIKTYTSADGLARNHIECIVQDSHGFLWFCTPEGLSRFDGYGFVNYHREQGLPGDYALDFLETRRGVYWVATNGGLARFHPDTRGASRFQAVPLNGPHGAAMPLWLYEDPRGGVWCPSRYGILFYLGPHDTAFQPLDFHVTAWEVTALLEDRQGVLWIGTPDGLYRRARDGSIARFELPQGFSHAYLMALLEDRQGRLWIGTRDGLIRLEGGQMRVYTAKDGLPGNRIEALLESSDGTLWTSGGGLAEWTPAEPENGHEFQSYTVEEGLSDTTTTVLAEDRFGNLWIATNGGGVMKVNRSGFITYTSADGLQSPRALLESRQGDLCVVFKASDDLFRIARLDGRRFTAFRPAWPPFAKHAGWGGSQIAIHDHTGDWWIATENGLCRFGPMDRVGQLAGARPKAVYTTRDGLVSDDIFRIFEDSRGDIWIGTGATTGGLARWDRRTGTVRVYSEADGLTAQGVPTAFTEDRAGDLWISLFNRELARYRGGRFTVFTHDVVGGPLNRVFTDSAGRVWASTSRGLVRIDDPAGDRPRFVLYTTAQGLSSNDIGEITEDRFGRLYAITGRAVDRFEARPDGLRQVRHYTTADGLAPGELRLAWSDREGSVWIGTSQGISHLIPGPDPVLPPPPVLVTGLSAGGVAQAISELGESDLAGLRLPQTPLRIDFTGLSFAPGETLRYQYMLTSLDRDWSAATDQRTVTYASLAAGSYRFLVRAVASDGAVSPHPAAVSFTIPPPFWRTWWFLCGCAMAAGSLAYALHRYRLAQLLRLAEVRMRIATDLHDDIGASLSQIAILSEVAQTRANGSQNGTPLAEIAGISRELVDGMSDIVWAINPEHDHLSNLVYRMRRFATDLLDGKNIALRFQSSVGENDPKIDANMRRQVYLILKEAIHNVVRHSAAKSVEVELEQIQEALVLQVGDDGRGFDPSAQFEGHGLASMRKRAAALDGTIAFSSSPGLGTTVRVSVKLKPVRSLAMLRGRWTAPVR